MTLLLLTGVIMPTFGYSVQKTVKGFLVTLGRVRLAETIQALLFAGLLKAEVFTACHFLRCTNALYFHAKNLIRHFRGSILKDCP